MKKIVWKYGLIASAILCATFAASTAFQDQLKDARGEIIGYTSMVVAFLMVYFGIRSYRNESLTKTISFKRALTVGALIALIASVAYVASWEVVYYNFMPDFSDKYAARVVEKAKSSGKSEQHIAATVKQMAEFKEQYKNLIVNVSYTLLEVLPLGIVVALISAGILSRRKPDPANATSMA